MFFRAKRSGDREYLQLVESERVEGRVRQRVLASLGRMDELRASGQLARLTESLGACPSNHHILRVRGSGGR